MTSYVLKELFGDTGRVRILEELTERWGEYLSIKELARMTDISAKTVYTHVHQLEDNGIVVSKKAKYGLNVDDKRALALAILEDEEVLRKIKLSIAEIDKEPALEPTPYFEFVKSNNTSLFSVNKYELTLV